MIDPTQEMRADRPISSRTARILHTADIDSNEKVNREMEMKYRQLPTKSSGRLDRHYHFRRTMRVVGSLNS